ncbi:hypothetical protein [Streptomyces sp. TRM75561]|uniref:hypothetical protein n=1 Tax=Streptomyces sp. TRM75561 TaxID=2975269 RepID=UPI002447C8BC|nr:hypothetical protein [Streptomyces sp. TRM75561]MDH3039228.1 hypothetical protein [Streptomyces sp. TRM75561]
MASFMGRSVKVWAAASWYAFEPPPKPGEHGGGRRAVLNGGRQDRDDPDAVADGGHQRVRRLDVLAAGEADAGAGRTLPAGADTVGGQRRRLPGLLGRLAHDRVPPPDGGAGGMQPPALRWILSRWPGGLSPVSGRMFLVGLMLALTLGLAVVGPSAERSDVAGAFGSE